MTKMLSEQILNLALWGAMLSCNPRKDICGMRQRELLGYIPGHHQHLATAKKLNLNAWTSAEFGACNDYFGRLNLT